LDREGQFVGGKGGFNSIGPAALEGKR